MFKIFKEIRALLVTQVENQEKINKKLDKLVDENITISGLNSKFITINNSIDTITTRLESNIYTKEQTDATIRNIIQYENDYKECKQTDSILLEFIEKYCKYNDDEEKLQLFHKLYSEYEIKVK